jgi:hypothetical protein
MKKVKGLLKQLYLALKYYEKAGNAKHLIGYQYIVTCKTLTNETPGL